jgi:hypothetical protein
MKVKDVIFCDDIRSEINNKSSLMGIYADRIVFKFNSMESEKWPIFYRLCLLLRVQLEPNDPRVDKFKFHFIMNGKNMDELEGLVKMEDGINILTINILAEGLPIEKGSLGFAFNLFFQGKEVFSANEPTALKVLSEHAN